MSFTTSDPKYNEKPPPYTPMASNVPPSSYQQAPVHTIPPGYYPTPTTHLTPLPGSYVTSYGATAGATQVVMPEIIIVGACPACRVGVLEDDYTGLGIFCAIFFFPLGILCCLLLKNKRCSNCGAYFG